MLARVIRKAKYAFPKNDWRDEEFSSLLSGERLNNLEISGHGQEDSHNIVYWVFFVYGIAMLLPWNVFITASEYFARRFAETAFEETFQNYFSTYFSIANLAVFAIMLWKRNKSPNSQVDILVPVSINTVIFGIMAATVVTPVHGESYFWFSMSLLVLSGVTTALFQMSVFAEASRFSSKYIQAVMSGQGVAGVAVAAASILSAFAGSANGAPKEEDISRAAFLYFLSALALTATALVGRVIVSTQAFYVRQSGRYTPTLASDEDGNLVNASCLINDSEDKVSLWSVIRKSAGLIFTIWYIFCVTLSVFPSISALIKSVSRHNSQTPDLPLAAKSFDRLLDDDMFVSFHFLLFNIGDWIGRTLPISRHFRTINAKALATFSLLRTAFIPIFLVCNVVASDRTLPLLIDNDLAYFCIVLLFSLTSGWLSSLAMMAAPQQESIHTSTEKSLVGSVMSFSLLVGLATGGSLSFFVRAMV